MQLAEPGEPAPGVGGEHDPTAPEQRGDEEGAERRGAVVGGGHPQMGSQRSEEHRRNARGYDGHDREQKHERARALEQGQHPQSRVRGAADSLCNRLRFAIERGVIARKPPRFSHGLRHIDLGVTRRAACAIGVDEANVGPARRTIEHVELGL